MTTPFQIATRLLKVFSAADSQHRFQPNRALRPGSIREAQCSVEAFFCHSFALLHSVALRRRSSHPSCARHLRQQTLFALARFPPFVIASGLHVCYAVSAALNSLRASFVILPSASLQLLNLSQGPFSNLPGASLQQHRATSVYSARRFSFAALKSLQGIFVSLPSAFLQLLKPSQGTVSNLPGASLQQHRATSV